MFHILEEVRSGVVMELEMIYIHMVMMEPICGRVVDQVWSSLTCLFLILEKEITSVVPWI